MKYELVVSPEAKIEIKNIKYYLKYILLSPKASENFETELFKKFDYIETEPHLYPPLPIGKITYKFACVNAYIVVFEINEDKRRVEVITVTHDTCNFKAHLKKKLKKD